VQGLTRKYPELDGVRRAMNDSVVNPDLDREFDALMAKSSPTLPNPAVSSQDTVLDAALVPEGTNISSADPKDQVAVSAKAPKQAKAKKASPAPAPVVEAPTADPVPASDPFEGV